MEVLTVTCPQCNSKRVYHDGLRYLKDGTACQRWLCRDCDFRFSLSNSNKQCQTNYNRQICVVMQEAKNLTTETELKTVSGESQKTTKGKQIEFAWYLKKENYSEETIRTYNGSLRNLIEAGANISDPNSVKEALMKYSEARKHVFIATYTLFLKMQGLIWNPPLCQVTRPLPFIPTERELDDLIAGSGRKMSAFLQTLKETAMRTGEAVRVKWKDLDLQRKTIALNQTEKHGNPRMFTISNKLIEMLSALPKNTEYVFGAHHKSAKAASFYLKRKTLAQKLGNPRLLEIGFHTFRHWKATTLYHETKDIVLVKQFLGHRSIDTTMLYIQLENALFRNQDDGFIVKATSDQKEIAELLEVGFEYVCQKDNLLYFRKRK
jgi:integrase